MRYLSRIRHHYDELTENQRRLADIIVSSADAAFLTTTDIAKVADVSQSAVVRFAQTLGYDGYPQLQKELQSNLIGRLNPSDRLRRSRRNEGVDLSEAIVDLERRQLKRIGELARSEAFEHALTLIEAAERTYVIGIRASHTVAHLFSTTLGYIKPTVKLLPNAGGAVADEIVHISDKDLLVSFSFPRYSVLTLKAMRFANERKAKVLAVTDSVLSPSGRLADVVLEVPAISPSFFTSYTSTSCLINLLIAHLAERQGGDAVESLRSLDRLLEDWGHWTK